MPVIILLDTSLSMSQHVSSGNNCNISRLKLATHGINSFLDCQASHNRFDLTALLFYSDKCELIKGFTREYEKLKDYLQNVHLAGKTNLIQALKQVKQMVVDEWGTNFNYHVLIVTDGNAVLQSSFLNKCSGLFNDPSSSVDLTESNHWPLPLPFKSKIHILCMTTLNNASFRQSLPFYKEILSRNCPNNSKPANEIVANIPCDGGQIWVPNVEVLSNQIMEDLFIKLNFEHFKPLTGKINCGNLTCPVTLYPNLPLEQAKNHNFIEMKICGFLTIEEVASPAVYSRHLILPMSETMEEYRNWMSFLNVRSDITETELESMFGEEGRQPSFAVLLHGSFKVANMVALCQLSNQPQWYGLIYSGVDNKKKSCLMLSTFEPGVDSIPWISKITNLGLLKAEESLPAKASKKTSNYVTWLNQPEMQTDVQKLLRYSRKLPDKQDALIQEATRIKKTAMAFHFFEAIDAVTIILEREATLLPSNTHPEALPIIANVIKYLKSHDS